MTPTIDSRVALGFGREVLQVEARFLSAGRHDPRRLHDVAVDHKLSAQSFAEPLHSHIFAILLVCASQNYAPTLDDTRRLLAMAGILLNGRGVPDELDRLWWLECCSAGLESWARLVADYARRRTEACELIRRANEILAEVLPPAPPAPRLRIAHTVKGLKRVAV